MSNLRPHRRVMFLAIVLMALMSSVVVAGTVGTVVLRKNFKDVIDTEVPRLDHLLHVDRDLLRAQRSLESGVTTSNHNERENEVFEYRRQVERTGIRWESYLEVSADGANELMWQDVYETARISWLSSSQSLASLITNDIGLDSVVARSLLNSTRDDFATMRGAVDDLEDRIAEPLIESSTESVLHHSELTIDVLAALMILGFLIGGTISLNTYRAARTQHRSTVERDRERDRDAETSAFKVDLNHALEMAQTELTVIHSTELVLDDQFPDRPVEVLLADSSQAHLERVLSTNLIDRGAGCPVQIPFDCPAIRRGTVQSFRDGSSFAACPNLRDRPGDNHSAVCIPMSVAGRTVGVVHSIGPNMETADSDLVETLETISSRVGDRIGVLRAFAKSETMAATDPLTGLANRRSFENEVSDMIRRGDSLAIAYGDLDRFKILNDTHGHDTGDRALRLFSRVVCDSLRNVDMAARWGGEEFVIMFGNSDSSTAAAALDRLRQNLSIAISSGSTPPFTVSFGVSDTSMGDNLEELINLADDALMNAKSAGRDRVHIAGRDTQGTGAEADIGPSSTHDAEDVSPVVQERV